MYNAQVSISGFQIIVSILGCIAGFTNSENLQVQLLTSTTGFEPKFKMYGGTKVSNLALQYVFHFIFECSVNKKKKPFFL